MFKPEERVKPILKWAGGKSQLLPQLTDYFPKRFKRYLEPFLGSGACFFSLSEEMPTILNDQNSELIDLYKTVRNSPWDLMHALDGLRKLYSETFYYQLRRSRPTCKIEKAARTVFLNKTGFNGLYRQNSNGDFNVPFGKRERCPKLYDQNQLLRASMKLKTAKLYSLDFEKIMNLAGKDDFVYCDPPYEPVSRTSSFNSYRKGGFPRSDQERLLIAAQRAYKRGATVLISNSHSPFIKELYEDHNVHHLRARRSINSKADRRSEIIEVLIEVLG